MDTFNFTKKTIAELPAAPEGKQVEYADSGVVGLLVRVGATGIKSFCVARYRDKRFIRATLGGFPDIFPAAQGGIITDPRRGIDQISRETAQNGAEPPIAFTCHDARRTFGSVAELVGVGSYILKRLMNHKTMRSADVTQGYLHFSTDELQEPAQKLERAILEYAWLVEKTTGIDNQLLAVMGTMTDEEKRRMLFNILNLENNEKRA